MKRKTKETKVEVTFGGDDVATTIPIFDHLLTQFSKFSGLRLDVKATGDNQHHIIEDVAICLGKELLNLEIIERVGHAFVPMDDALALAIVDLSDRGYPVICLPNGEIDGVNFTTLTHFLETLSREGRFNLHVYVANGRDDHHIAEAVFKAVGEAIRRVGRAVYCSCLENRRV